MNCSSSERLGAALLASFALHAALIAGVERLGARWDGVSWHRPAPVLRATIRELPPAAEAVAPSSAALPLPRYYRLSELDVRPWIMTRVEPQYPESAKQRSLTGTVRIQLYIDETGRVERVQTLQADPPGVFENSAERAFLAARFTPAMKDGRPVKARMTLEVKFE